MDLYAMVDASGHVCRDEDGKVVYEREDHHALDVRRFNMHRPQSKPHTVVRFVTHADYKALEEDRDAWRRLAEDFGNQAGEQKRLTAELAECRADALRYRWLRICDHLGDRSVHGEGPDFFLMSGTNLDDAIDQAIARSRA